MRSAWLLAVATFLVQPCRGPAVSVSFSSKSAKNLPESFVFSLKNGTWVAVEKAAHSPNATANRSRQDNVPKSSHVGELGELFKKINRTIPLKDDGKLSAAKLASTKATKVEKSIGELFLEWLAKQEESEKRITSKVASQTSIPVLGVQIDFTDGKNKKDHHKTLVEKAAASSPVLHASKLAHGMTLQTLLLGQELQKAASNITSHRRVRRSRWKRRPHKRSEDHTEPSQLPSTDPPDTQEYHSGQLLVRNELTNDSRKTKLNDLPKYVMKFLAQCKALIDQNYEDVDSADVDPTFDNVTGEQRDMKEFVAPSTRSAVRQNIVAQKPVDEFDTIDISRGNRSENNKTRSGRSEQDMDDDYQNFLERPTVDDVYNGMERVRKFKGNRNLNTYLATKPTYFVGECQTSRPYANDLTPERNPVVAGGTDSCETTLNHEQWGLLLDLLRDRQTSGTKCTTPKPSEQCTQATCTTCRTRTICSSPTAICPTCTTSCSTCPSCLKTTDRATTRCPCSTIKKKCSTTKPCTTTCKTTKCTPCVTSKTTTRCKTTKQPCKTTCSTRCSTTCSTSPTCPTTCSTRRPMCPLKTSCPTTCSTKKTCPTKKPTCNSTCRTKPTCSTKPACSTKATCPTKSTCSVTCQTKSSSSTTSNTNDCGGYDYTNSDTDYQEGESHSDVANPGRYLVKLGGSKRPSDPLQEKSRNNWFENIRNLKLLEGLKAPNPSNSVKSLRKDIPNNHSSLPAQDQSLPPERMVAEGSIPLKTGSQLNLYISYVLDKTRAKNKSKNKRVNFFTERRLLPELPGHTARHYVPLDQAPFNSNEWERYSL